MLRIDPAHPPVWRTPSILQFGSDDATTLVDPEPWQLRLVRELEAGVPESALEPLSAALGAPDGGGDDLARQLRRVLVGPPRRLPPVTLIVGDGIPHGVAEEIAGALSAAGARVVDDPSAVSVVVAHRVVEPRLVARLMAEDVPHVLIVFAGDGAEVGPVVTPGETACVTCLAAHRYDADEAWPAVAAQLAHTSAWIDGGIAIEAAVAAVRLIDDAARHPHRRSSPSVHLRSDSVQRTRRMHRPHEGCPCRSLAGIATAPAPVVLVPTTPRAYARPA